MMDQSASFSIELLPAPKFKRSFAKSECVFEVLTDCIGRKVQVRTWNGSDEIFETLASEFQSLKERIHTELHNGFCISQYIEKRSPSRLVPLKQSIEQSSIFRSGEIRVSNGKATLC